MFLAFLFDIDFLRCEKVNLAMNPPGLFHHISENFQLLEDLGKKPQQMD